MEQENNAANRETNVGGSTGDEESSYSSFYSSFLKTDAGSGSNEDNNNPEIKTEKDDKVWWCNCLFPFELHVCFRIEFGHELEKT